MSVFDKAHYLIEKGQHEGKARGYRNRIRELNNIKNAASGQLSDEQSNVNREIGELMDDLEKAVRHEQTFASNIRTHNNYKEGNSYSDTDLSQVISSIEEEISDLERKATDEDDAAYEAYRNYQDAD